MHPVLDADYTLNNLLLVTILFDTVHLLSYALLHTVHVYYMLNILVFLSQPEKPY